MRDMLAAVICCVSVLCTTSLASFGMDMAAIRGSSTSKNIVTGESEDVMRLSSGCLLFHEFFAALAILVSIAYYAIVKASLLAMGAVIMTPPKPHPIYYQDEDEPDEFEEVEPAESRSESSSSPSSDEEDAEQHSSPREPPNAACKPAESEEVEMKENSKATPADTSAEIEQDHDLEEVVIFEASAAQPPAPKRKSKRPAPGTHRRAASLEMKEYPLPSIPERQPVLSRSRPAKHHPAAAEQEAGSLQPAATERFNAVKIWTNIYGLSIGVYCLVYSLLLPNELSAFVFCVAALVASIFEWAVPCMRVHLSDGYSNLEGSGTRSSSAATMSSKLRGLAGAASSAAAAGAANPPESENFPRKQGEKQQQHKQQKCKRCLGLICIILDELLMAGGGIGKLGSSSRSSIRGRHATGSSRLFGCRHRGSGGSRRRRICSMMQQCVSSGALAMPCFILLIALGLVFKVLEAVFWQDAIEKNRALFAAAAAAVAGGDKKYDGEGNLPQPWPSYSPTLLGSMFRGSDKARFDAVNACINVLFPIVGVLALKSMRKAQNVRETIELAVPVCGVNSLCIVCIILMQNSICLSKHLSSTITMADATKSFSNEDSSSVNYYYYYHDGGSSHQQPQQPLIPRNWTSAPPAYPNGDGGGGSSRAIIRYQPILAALALPFPLVCSIVCIVTAGRNHRVMDVAASIFLAYSAKQFEGNRWYFSETETLPDGQVTQESRYSENMSSTMGSFSLSLAGCVCLGLAAYRMRWGDDHGNSAEDLEESMIRSRLRHGFGMKKGAKRKHGMGGLKQSDKDLRAEEAES